MATSSAKVLQHLRRTVLLRDGEALTDGQLLECFVGRREGAALEVLVRRHGPMVWSVCRRLLRHHHDAEDAFQATFLVLVRKAASIRARDLLANWLYGVARQTALKARQTAARRQAREKQVANVPEPEAAPQDQEPGRDLQALLDQELSRLPDKYRSAIVLCDLEGKSRHEAAQQLGLPEGTVASRLARARTLLARRLARHGLAVSGATLAVMLAQQAAPASVPATVLGATIETTGRLAAGQALAALVPANVVSLTEGVLKAMLLIKLRAATLVLALVGVGLFAGLLTLHLAAAPPSQADKVPPPERKGATDTHGTNVVKPDGPPEVKGAVSSPFRVQVEPEKKQVQVDKEFKVRVVVVNVSSTAQSFKAASGSWGDHWQTNNNRIERHGPLEVFRNVVETIKLDPGQCYEKTLTLRIKPGEPLKEVVFKMGFTPLDGKETYWSDAITVQIEEGQ